MGVEGKEQYTQRNYDYFRSLNLDQSDNSEGEKSEHFQEGEDLQNFQESEIFHDAFDNLADAQN